jgi:4-hydroxy-tetrahydrodipicolinate reductase
MGKAVRDLAREREWPVILTIGSAGNERGAGLTRERFAGANVAIEFTTPTAAPDNVRACMRAGMPVVCGTTGWNDQLDAVSREVLSAGGALLWAANFSIGVNLFWKIAARAAREMANSPDFDAHIIETHHAAKRDAPSGTGIILALEAGDALGRRIPVTSIRMGSVPGTHELLFDGRFEQLRLEHVVRDRRVFAEGALAAAAWLVKEDRRGIFTMSDVLLSREGS